MSSNPLEQQLPIELHDKSDIIALFHEYQRLMTEGKRDQWRAIYYAFLVLAGIFGYLEVRDGPDLGEIFFLIFFYYSVTTFVARHVWRLHFALVRYRDRTQEIRPLMSREFATILPETNSRRDFEFPVVFSTVMWAAAGFLFWYLLDLCGNYSYERLIGWMIAWTLALSLSMFFTCSVAELAEERR